MLTATPLSREASGEDLLRRPDMTYAQLTSLSAFAPALDDAQAAEQVEIQVKYEGYIARQQEEIERQQRNENTLLPATLDYRRVSGLSNEVIAKLNDHKPVSIGQASRISGVTPAAISILLVWLKNKVCCAAALDNSHLAGALRLPAVQICRPDKRKRIGHLIINR